MIRQISWLLCSSILFSSAAFAEDAQLLAQANTDAPPAPVALAPAEPAPATPAPLVAGGVITLDAAIERALAESPRLKSFGFARMASKGVRSQAGALPNPELGVEAENIGGQGPYKGFDSAEVTYGVSQLVEIGGKRSARKEVASQGYEIASFEYQAARLDIIRDVTIAYAEAVAAKEAVALAEKQKSLANEVLTNVTERVNAAAEPLFQRSKSEVALATSDIALDKAQRDYTIARKQLAALWGADGTAVDIDSSHFSEVSPPEPLASVESVKRNPDFVRWDAELARSRANLNLEQANAIPDPSLSVGMRDFRDSGDRAFVAGVSIPIPVFNMNRGNIERARQEVSKTESDKRSAEITIGTELSRSQQELENAYRQAQSLKNTIIPAAEKSYSLSRQGYRAGKFPYLEVLDAQRTLVEARAQYNDTLKEYHTKRAEVERLTAKHLPATNQKDEADE